MVFTTPVGVFWGEKEYNVLLAIGAGKLLTLKLTFTSASLCQRELF
jgi:hypothetical protein